ncbi:MAG: maltodextrin glucosidase [Lachnospiraceae bacterium]|nr:maltodextrin glucosidase [Lachnospiraceae bacterium]
MWYDEAVFYQIYPLGMLGAPEINDGVQSHRIRKVVDWIPHLKKLGVNAVYFCPIFESDCHGYDTRDYQKIDCRLGDFSDMKMVVSSLHEAGIRVVLDGVFNHVGRGFWAFQDVKEKKWDSPYKDWFHINFDGNNDYQDGFWYEGWEGYYNLVKLNLYNPQVKEYLKDCIRLWVKELDIDGLRLDVAYCLEDGFVRELRELANSIKPEFWLLGEMLHGDYNMKMGEDRLHSVTNYECYKGLYSSFNSMNLFEIAHSIARQFGPEAWCLYRGKHLLNFVDNHDVNRIATVLNNANHLPLIYGLLCAMPGIPCIYYGSEWGIKGQKENGSDAGIRPYIEMPTENELTQWISKCVKAHKESKALCYGSYRMVLLTNRQYIFERAVDGERVLIAINAEEQEYQAHFDAGCGKALDLLSGAEHDFGGGSVLPPYSVFYWKCER